MSKVVNCLTMHFNSAAFVMLANQLNQFSQSSVAKYNTNSGNRRHRLCCIESMQQRRWREHGILNTEPTNEFTTTSHDFLYVSTTFLETKFHRQAPAYTWRNLQRPRSESFSDITRCICSLWWSLQWRMMGPILWRYPCARVYHTNTEREDSWTKRDGGWEGMGVRGKGIQKGTDGIRFF